MQKGNNELFSGLNTVTTISFYLVSSVVAGILLGRWIDGYFGSQPLVTMIGIVLGMISGMWAIYKKVLGGK